MKVITHTEKEFAEDLVKELHKLITNKTKKLKDGTTNIEFPIKVNVQFLHPVVNGEAAACCICVTYDDGVIICKGTCCE